MIHQINLESIAQATKIVKKCDTKLLECYEQSDRLKDKNDKKSLLKTYKINKDIENELKHLINTLDNHMSSIEKEVHKLKDEISLVGLKNKQQQISLLLHNEQESSFEIESEE